MTVFHVSWVHSVFFSLLLFSVSACVLLLSLGVSASHVPLTTGSGIFTFHVFLFLFQTSAFFQLLMFFILLSFGFPTSLLPSSGICQPLQCLSPIYQSRFGSFIPSLSLRRIFHLNFGISGSYLAQTVLYTSLAILLWRFMPLLVPASYNPLLSVRLSQRHLYTACIWRLVWCARAWLPSLLCTEFVLMLRLMLPNCCWWYMLWKGLLLPGWCLLPVFPPSCPPHWAPAASNIHLAVTAGHLLDHLFHPEW